MEKRIIPDFLAEKLVLREANADYVVLARLTGEFFDDDLHKRFKRLGGFWVNPAKDYYPRDFSTKSTGWAIPRAQLQKVPGVFKSWLAAAEKTARKTEVERNLSAERFRAGAREKQLLAADPTDLSGADLLDRARLDCDMLHYMLVDKKAVTREHCIATIRARPSTAWQMLKSAGLLTEEIAVYGAAAAYLTRQQGPSEAYYDPDRFDAAVQRIPHDYAGDSVEAIVTTYIAMGQAPAVQTAALPGIENIDKQEHSYADLTPRI